MHRPGSLIAVVTLATLVLRFTTPALADVPPRQRRQHETKTVEAHNPPPLTPPAEPPSEPEAKTEPELVEAKTEAKADAKTDETASECCGSGKVAKPGSDASDHPRIGCI